MSGKLSNAFTVDVEDYFHVAALSKAVNPKDWDTYECRVVQNTNKILQLLDDSSQTATFFVLGWVAARYPNLVKEIHSCGHEIASHGMSHQLIYNQSIDEFRKETVDSKSLLEDLIQSEILGYRAATYSITNKSLWALDILYEAGYKYDSSIFPMRHDKYGIPDVNHLPHILTTPSGYKLVEFPISVLKRKLMVVPIAGGGYFRLFPYNFTKWGLQQSNNANQPFVFYIHPWELDPEQPQIEGIGRFSKFRHYNNLNKCEIRLKKLLSDFKFCTMGKVLHSLGLLRVSDT